MDEEEARYLIWMDAISAGGPGGNFGVGCGVVVVEVSSTNNCRL